MSFRQRPARLRGSSCTGGGANADIADGTAVVIADGGTKKVVAIATLGRGTVVTYPGSGVNFSDCRFDFRVTIPDRLQYCIKVANRTAFWRSRDAMEQDGWTVDIGLPLPPVPPYYPRRHIAAPRSLRRTDRVRTAPGVLDAAIHQGARRYLDRTYLPIRALPRPGNRRRRGIVGWT